MDILVLETIHARVLGGEIIEYAVWGELLLNCSTISSEARRFDFQIFNSEAMTKVAPNTAILTGGQQGAWSALIPGGTDAPVCVMKYKVATTVDEARRQVPLKLDVRWQCTEKATVIDVDYALTSDGHPPGTHATKLLDVKFLIALAPEKCIRECLVSTPVRCMYSAASQKMMWQLTNLPSLEAPHETSGRLHAELSNADVACQPAPLSVSFMSDDLDSALSKILVTEGERRPGSHALPLGRLICRLKSGIYTVY